jgi:hypothetical protein
MVKYDWVLWLMEDENDGQIWPVIALFGNYLEDSPEWSVILLPDNIQSTPGGICETVQTHELIPLNEWTMSKYLKSWLNKRP